MKTKGPGIANTKLKKYMGEDSKPTVKLQSSNGAGTNGCPHARR